MRVDLWVWSLDVRDEALAVLLTEEERARAARFVRPLNGAQYIAARGTVRKILAGYLGVAPQAIVFAVGPHGKPSVEGLSFNFSDSGALGALAVSREGALGVDIERVSERGHAALARRYFAPAEIAAFEALPEAEQAAAFYRVWTRKEAFLKAMGTGLATDLRAFEVSLTEEARLLRVDDKLSEDRAAWTMASFTPAEGYAGAVAARTGGATLELVNRALASESGA